MALSIWAVYCSHRRPWNMSWSTWEKTCKHRRHCWNLWVRLEDVVSHCGLFYWILRWKFVFKLFILFRETPWKISGTFTGSFTDGCLLLVGSCQLKAPPFTTPRHWHHCFCQSTQSWSSRTVLWAWRVVVWALSLELVGFWWYSDIPWGMKWDGSHVLETDLGPKKIDDDPGNSQRLTVDPLIDHHVRSDSHCLWDWQRVRSQDDRNCQSAWNFWRLVVLCWDACYNSPCLWSSFYFKVLFGESWSANFWQGFRLKIAGNWLEDDISTTVHNNNMWMYAMQLDLPFH